MVGARLFPVRNLLFTLESKNYLVEEFFGPLSRESSTMAESKGSATQPRLRDVIASLRPQVMFWWGAVAAFFVSGVIAAVLAASGIFSVNSSGLVSLDSEKVALEIQLSLEESGVTSTVGCPGYIAAPIGFSFVCMVNTPEARVTQAEVTIVNVLGEIIWNLRDELPTNG